MSRIKIKPIKRTLKARRGLAHEGDYILASLDELIHLTGDDPNIIRRFNHPRFPSGTQFGFSFFTEIRGRRLGFLVYDYQVYFPLLGPEWIHWKIDASSKATSKEFKLHMEELLYSLRKSKKTAVTEKQLKI